MADLDIDVDESNTLSIDSSTTAREVVKLKAKLQVSRAKLHKITRRNNALAKQMASQESKIKKLFAEDQLLALSRGMRGIRWSSATVKKAIQLRFACGATGYNLLSQVFKYLAVKVNNLCEEERVCCLTLDEMSITPSIEYDASSGQLLGNVTLPGHCGSATHALVFMLGGLSSRWKQTVAYHFTGNSTDGTVMKPIVLELLNVLQR